VKEPVREGLPDTEFEPEDEGTPVWLSVAKLVAVGSPEMLGLSVSERVPVEYSLLLGLSVSERVPVEYSLLLELCDIDGIPVWLLAELGDQDA
jgi:hypothetical protein